MSTAREEAQDSLHCNPDVSYVFYISQVSLPILLVWFSSISVQPTLT